jgi:hypothetical protein
MTTSETTVQQRKRAERLAKWIFATNPTTGVNQLQKDMRALIPFPAIERDIWLDVIACVGLWTRAGRVTAPLKKAVSRQSTLYPKDGFR